MHLFDLHTFDHTTQRLPMDMLQNMELPEVPDELKGVLSVNWKGKYGIPAPSAVAALTNKSGWPMVVFSMVWHSKIIEEEYPFKTAKSEFEIFSQVAQENLV